MTRVRVKNYDLIGLQDPRLWPVPSVGDRACRLHWAAASALADMQRAWPGAGMILVCSGWRPHRWRSWRHYVTELVRRYTTRDEKASLSQLELERRGLREGRKWLAFDSPHETGLAFDIGSHGLWPARKTAAQQKCTKLYRWLRDHAAAYGVTNYHREPWHWEVVIPRELWELEGPEASGLP